MCEMPGTTPNRKPMQRAAADGGRRLAQVRRARQEIGEARRLGRLATCASSRLMQDFGDAEQADRDRHEGEALGERERAEGEARIGGELVEPDGARARARAGSWRASSAAGRADEGDHEKRRGHQHEFGRRADRQHGARQGRREQRSGRRSTACRRRSCPRRRSSAPARRGRGAPSRSRRGR